MVTKSFTKNKSVDYTPVRKIKIFMVYKVPIEKPKLITSYKRM